MTSKGLIINSMKSDFIFVHAGKCGGSTIEKLLKNNNIKYEIIHCRTCDFNKNKKYLILLRNPVERFVSAFYWRKYLVEELRPNPEQKKFFKKYKSINDLCEELYIDKADSFDKILNQETHQDIQKKYHGKSHPTHLAMGLDFYLNSFIGQCSKEHIVDVICTETLNYDMLKSFNIKNNKKREKDNRKRKEKISDENRLHLKKYLKKDYEVIDYFHNIGVLNKDKYNFLSI